MLQETLITYVGQRGEYASSSGWLHTGETHSYSCFSKSKTYQSGARSNTGEVEAQERSPWNLPTPEDRRRET